MVDKRLLEMAKVYRMPTGRVIRYIYIPEIVDGIKRLFTGKGEKK